MLNGTDNKMLINFIYNGNKSLNIRTHSVHSSSMKYTTKFSMAKQLCVAWHQLSVLQDCQILFTVIGYMNI